jgi:uncharacterized protein
MSGGFSLLPKNDVYFADFDEAAGLCREAVRILNAAVGKPTIPKETHGLVRAVETKTAAITDRVLQRLDESFITPIEREDIHRLITELDGVVDDLEGLASRLDIYDIHEPTAELRNLMHALDEMADRTVACIATLRLMDPKRVREEARRVGELEERCDDLYRNALRSLFAAHPKAWDLVRWKEVYDIVENVSDDLFRLVRTVGHIMVRHS